MAIPVTYMLSILTFFFFCLLFIYLFIYLFIFHLFLLVGG